MRIGCACKSWTATKAEERFILDNGFYICLECGKLIEEVGK